MKNITAMVMCLVVGGNITYNTVAEASKPLIYQPEIVEEAPKEVQIRVVTNWTPERIEQEIEEQAEKYGADAEVMKAVLFCESGGSTTVQSYHINSAGVREDSWGIAQFWLPAKNRTRGGDVITKEMALDPKIAIETMAWYFSLGKQELWSCYNLR